MLTALWTSPYWLISLSLVAFFGYLPLNRFLKKGYHWKSPLDDRLPLIPWFVYPYLFFYFPWMLIFYFTLYFRPLEDIQHVFVSTLLATSIGYLFFFFLPTYVITSYPKGKGPAIKLLQFLYVADKPFNACPSMHVFMTILVMLFSWSWWPEYGLLWLTLGVLISVSTVLTKRHYVYDVAGGVIVGVLSYLLTSTI